MRSTRGRCAAALVAALLASACGESDPEKPTAAGGPVRLLAAGAPEELAAYRTLIDAYAKANAGADVQLVEASDADDLMTRLSTSVAGGAPPDVFLMNYRLYGQLAAKDAIEPVDERLKSSTVVKADAFYPVALNAFKWRGKQLCIPQNVSSLVVYYNRDLFSKYGVAEPKPGWTWYEMVSTASALTRDAGGAVVKGTDSEGSARKVATYGLAVEPQVIRVAPFVWSNGGTLVDNERKPTRFTFDTPPAREALKAFLELRTRYGVVPTDDEVKAEDDEARFVNGRLAMLIASRRVTATFRTIKGFEWDVAALPTHGLPANTLHSDAYCLTRGSKHKDAAWKFVEFANGPVGQQIISGTGRTVPSNVEVSRTRAFLDPTQPPRNAQVFLDNVPSIRQLPTISTWPEIEDVTGGILENALYRGDKLDDVIRQLDEKTRPVFARGEAP